MLCACRSLQIGADIVKRALPYSLKLIANNAGDNGSVVMQVHKCPSPLAATSVSSFVSHAI